MAAVGQEKDPPEDASSVPAGGGSIPPAETLDGEVPFRSAPTLEQPPREGVSSRIGPYRLMQILGEGGFGTVFLAEQSEPVRRRVALKLIKKGMDSAQVIARF